MLTIHQLCSQLIVDIVTLIKEICVHLSCFTITVLWLFFPLWIQYLVYKLLFSQYYFVVIVYVFWMVYDRNTLKRGGRIWQLSRDFFLWKYVHKYYPINIRKTAELSASKNYIFGLHPHGVVCYATAMSILLHDEKYRKLFPGITIRLCVHNLLVSVPVVREFMMFVGLCSVDKESVEYIISKMGTGKAAAIVVGGGKEFFLTQPYKLDLVLKNRKGFVRMALKHGASLVPVLGFGENEFLTEPNHPLDFLLNPFRRLSKINTTIQDLCIIPSLLIFVVINITTLLKRFSGIEKYRKHFTTIIGKPINVMKKENPTEQEVDELHALYINEVTEMFNEHRKQVPDGDKYQLSIH